MATEVQQSAPIHAVSLAHRPGMAWWTVLLRLNAPEIEPQGAHDHRQRDEVELGGEELRAPQRREPRVDDRSDHLETVPPVSAVLPNALRNPSGAVQRGRGEEFQLLAGQTPAQGPGILLGLV